MNMEVESCTINYQITRKKIWVLTGFGLLIYLGHKGTYKIKFNTETQAVHYGACANNEGFNNRFAPSLNRYQIDSCLLKNIRVVTMPSFICTNRPETELTLCNTRINSYCSITQPSPVPVNFFKIYLLPAHAMYLAIPIPETRYSVLPRSSGLARYVFLCSVTESLRQ